jgi:hypothetical protein
MSPEQRYADLAAGHLTDAIRMFLHIFLSSTAGVSRTDKLGMILEAWGVCLAAMGIALKER